MSEYTKEEFEKRFTDRGMGLLWRDGNDDDDVTFPIEVWQWIEEYGKQQRVDELQRIRKELNTYQVYDEDADRARADAWLAIKIDNRINYIFREV